MEKLEENINYLSNLEISTRSYLLGLFLGSILIIVYVLGCIQLFLFSYSWLSYAPSGEIGTFEIIVTLILLASMMLLIADGIWFCIQKLNIPKNLKKYSILLYGEYRKTINLNEDFDTIYSLAKSIKKQTYFLIRLLKFNFIFSKAGKLKIKELLSLVLLISNEIFINLRSDLVTRLTEQRSILESAKSEVEQNITGTPELIAVSETQRVKLDRQIEQFEELQRVLVRV